MKAEDLLFAMNGIDDVIITKAYTYSSKNKIHFFQKRLSLAACICLVLLATATVTAIAAIHHFWGRGINGLIRSTDEQQQALTEQGQAIIYPESEDYTSYQVTDNGVTIAPETLIADEHYVYVSFKVSGFSVEGLQEPGAEVTYYLGDNPDDDMAWINGSSSFYDGIVPDENGQGVYDDGTAIEANENGQLITHYVGENGDLEYILLLSSTSETSSLLGQELHVNFTELGICEKADFKAMIEGEWNFTLDLPTVTSAEKIDINKAVPGTDCIIETIEVTPVSITVYYKVNGVLEQFEDSNGIPMFTGLGFKDGTNYKFLHNGGSSYYTDDSRSYAVNTAAFQRVIDPSQIKSLFIRTSDYEDAEIVEIELP